MSGIAKALEVAEECKEAMMDNKVMYAAAQLIHNASTATEEELAQLLFKYSGILTANVATRLTYVLMPKSDFDSMTEDIAMFDEIGSKVLGESN